MKGRKHIIDSLEDKTTDLQNKIQGLRQWNCNQMGLLEEREQLLDASLSELQSKHQDLQNKASEKEEEIKNVKGNKKSGPPK